MSIQINPENITTLAVLIRKDDREQTDLKNLVTLNPPIKANIREYLRGTLNINLR